MSADELDRFLDERMHVGIVANERHILAVILEQPLDCLRGPASRKTVPEIHCLRSIEQLDGKHGAAIIHHPH